MFNIVQNKAVKEAKDNDYQLEQEENNKDDDENVTSILFSAGCCVSLLFFVYSYAHSCVVCYLGSVTMAKIAAEEVVMMFPQLMMIAQRPACQ